MSSAHYVNMDCIEEEEQISLEIPGYVIKRDNVNKKNRRMRIFSLILMSGGVIMVTGSVIALFLLHVLNELDEHNKTLGI